MIQHREKSSFRDAKDANSIYNTTIGTHQYILNWSFSNVHMKNSTGHQNFHISSSSAPSTIDSVLEFNNITAILGDLNVGIYIQGIRFVNLDSMTLTFQLEICNNNQPSGTSSKVEMFEIYQGYQDFRLENFTFHDSPFHTAYKSNHGSYGGYSHTIKNGSIYNLVSNLSSSNSSSITTSSYPYYVGSSSDSTWEFFKNSANLSIENVEYFNLFSNVSYTNSANYQMHGDLIVEYLIQTHLKAFV